MANPLAFDILQRPEFAILRVKLEPGQRLFAEPSAMASMDAGIDLKAGFKGGVLSSMSRMLAGESLTLSTFSAERSGGEVMLAPGAAGDLVHYRLRGGR